jgi:hypothetical protein
MAEEEFLKRWSRQKMTKTDEAAQPDDLLVDGNEQASLPDIPEESAANTENDPPPELPPIDTLDKDSDYTPFLGDNVPEELAQKAFRKLWTSDPAFANLDGLNDYDDDYSMLGMVETVVETAYKIGKGYVSDDDDEEDDEIVEGGKPEETEALVEDEEAVLVDEDSPDQLAEVSADSIPHGEKG